MALWIGIIIGAGAGFVLSTFFIFPSDVLNLRIIEMTIGDILRILGGLLVVVMGGTLGRRSVDYFEDLAFRIKVWWLEAGLKAYHRRKEMGAPTGDETEKTGKEGRIELYGKMGSDRYNEHIARADAIAKEQKKGMT
jgi:hypothetical protein